MKPFEMGRKNKRDKDGGLLPRQPCILYDWRLHLPKYLRQIPPALLSLPFDREKGRHPLDDALLQLRKLLLRGLGGADSLDQHRGDLEQVAADAVVSDLKDGSGVVLQSEVLLR